MSSDKESRNDSDKEDNETAEPTTPIEVHSANAWEKADLGDDDRKSKFLRLMGAGKKEHHGRFIIGDHEPSHARATCRTAEMEHNLEEQYQHSLSHRLQGGRRGHIGLGFQEQDTEEPGTQADENKEEIQQDGSDEAITEKDEDACEEIEEEKEEVEEVVDQTPNKKDAKKRECTEKASAEESSEKKMKFIKASS